MNPHPFPHDSDGNPTYLGALDTSGRPVGFIDDDGLAWESRVERDVAMTAGRLLDATANPSPASIAAARDQLAACPSGLLYQVAAEVRSTQTLTRDLQRASATRESP